MDKIYNDDLVEFFNNKITITVLLNDIFYDNNIIVVLENGQVFEKLKGEIRWFEFLSKDEFKKITGASLDEEYKDSESKILLKLLKGLNKDFGDKIESVFVTDYPNKLLSNLIKDLK